MLKISYADCFGLSPAISANFTLEIRVPAPNREQFTKTPILRVQGHLRSLMFTFLKSSSPVLVMISNMSVLICNHFYIRRTNNGRITLLRWCPSFFSWFVETHFTKWHEILSQNTKESKLSYGSKKFELMLTRRAKAYSSSGLVV